VKNVKTNGPAPLLSSLKRKGVTWQNFPVTPFQF
jgi:hypothetical protein